MKKSFYLAPFQLSEYWKPYYPFFHAINHAKIKNRWICKIKTIWILILFIDKISFYHMFIQNIESPSSFAMCIDWILTKFMTLNFIRTQYFSIFAFVFGIILIAAFYYCYQNPHKFIQYNMKNLCYTCLHIISPIIFMYCSSFFRDQLMLVITGEYSILYIIITGIAFIIFFIFIIIGAFFDGRSNTSLTSMIPTWDRFIAIHFAILACIVEQTWFITLLIPKHKWKLFIQLVLLL